MLEHTRHTSALTVAQKMIVFC